LKYLFYKNNQTITLDLPDELIINLDQSAIERVMTNLISNALKYTPPKGFVEIKLKQIDSMAEISIIDKGIGLTRKEIQQLFRKFGKLSNRVEINSEGTGLGLFISKQIVELHGGQIWVTSEGKNKGSTFVVKLPLN
jgi:signal transduction histidine kinase